MLNSAKVGLSAGIIALLLVMVAGGALFYRMVGQLEIMTVLMGKMTDQVASMSQDMTAIRASMEKMEGHMERLGSSFGQGAQQMERVNPMRMMERMRPGAD
jgi:hypothetical protein